MKPPAWARVGDERATTMLDEATAVATQQKLDDAAAAERLHVGAIGHLPIDRERAAVELTEEQRALRSSRPKNRRWRSLQKLDDEVDDASRRVDEARQRLAEAEGRLHSAPEADAKSLAAWIEGGERGERPAPALDERQRDVEAARRLVQAATIALDQALERRLRWDRSRQHRDEPIPSSITTMPMIRPSTSVG